MSNPRVSNGAARRSLRKRVAAMGLPCAICGQPIRYDLPAGDPLSFELDEIIPVSRYREGGYASPTACSLDPRNVRPVHRICNQKRGNGLRKGKGGKPRPKYTPFKHSREW